MQARFSAGPILPAVVVMNGSNHITGTGNGGGRIHREQGNNADRQRNGQVRSQSKNTRRSVYRNADGVVDGEEFGPRN